MAIGRKESGSLVKKAGKMLVDLALNLSSNRPIANSAVTAKFNQVDTDLANKQQKVTYYHELTMKTFSGADQTIATITVAANHCVIATAVCGYSNVAVAYIEIVDHTRGYIIAIASPLNGVTSSASGITAVLSEGTYDVKVKTVSAGSNPFILTKVDFAID